MMRQDQPDIFDRSRRRDVYRTMLEKRETPFFQKMITDDLVERLEVVTRPFPRTLLVNPVDPKLEQYLKSTGSAVECIGLNSPDFEEDRPSLSHSHYDLIVVAWGLETVNDLPGALSLLRRSLTPDSLLLSSFPGAGSFSQFRTSMREAELEQTGKIEARFHPQIDIRAMGDLLQRTGYTLPVIDNDIHALKYASLSKVMEDILDHGWGELLAEPITPLTEGLISCANQKFMDGNHGLDSLNLISITAWTPGDNQPKPAARGSAQQNLSTALGRKAR